MSAQSQPGGARRAASPAAVFDGVAPAGSSPWGLATFLGRLVEISGSQTTAALTFAFRLVLEAQRRGEPVAWITGAGSSFYPPDAAAAAVDLDALVVIWAPGTLAAARSADRLVRSGAFGLVVLDLTTVADATGHAHVPVHVQSRLVGLAKKHDTALLCLTEKGGDQPSVGSLVSLRAETRRERREEDRFRCEARVLKDKRRGPGWSHVEVRRGPDGLR